ncbi:MAG: CHAP domain-containing protein [Alphaproteobacteria bacterium]|nr:CHAP domain-containing protein [Alphaproteobacteria bacterium]
MTKRRFVARLILVGLSAGSLSACATIKADIAGLSSAILESPGTATMMQSQSPASRVIASTASKTPRPSSLAGRGRGKPRIVSTGRFVQCVPFARDVSGIQIKGDAATWWAQAETRYQRGRRPEAGSVLVLKGYRNNRRGHVAVVTRVIDSRTIIIDHSNWLNDGRLHLDTPVIDVSRKNDWSEVRVWNIPGSKFGPRTYEVMGFILPRPLPQFEEASASTLPPVIRASYRIETPPAETPARAAVATPLPQAKPEDARQRAGAPGALPVPERKPRI